jgi:hypothetical protein
MNKKEYNLEKARYEDAEEAIMHPVVQEERHVPNRAERRETIARVLTRDQRLLVQEMKRDIVKALIKPKGLSKGQLRRRRRKDAGK